MQGSQMDYRRPADAVSDRQQRTLAGVDVLVADDVEDVDCVVPN